MKLSFQKYQANGNDFVMLLDLKHQIELSKEQIARICNRHFGIGADGLMLLLPSKQYDFEMVYYNSDGSPGSMCGNGGRSIAALAFDSDLASRNMQFLASDGLHQAIINKEIKEHHLFDVSLKMIDVSYVEEILDGYFLNTGVPHFVQFVDSFEKVNVEAEGRKIRNHSVFSPEGANVDFVVLDDHQMFVRTYERGVEGETLSCGTGVTASCIATYLKTGRKNLPVRTLGGAFNVSFKETARHFEDIWLSGPAQKVFEGEINLV